MIQNHSRLLDLDLEVRQHMVLVGPNDSGKSSVLRCLDLILGSTTAQLHSRITSADLRDTNLPLVIEVTLEDFLMDDMALFPDELTISPDGSMNLTIRLTAEFDDNGTLSIDRSAPSGRTGRQLSRTQLQCVSWIMLSATDSSRSLREDRRSLLDRVLSTIDLGDEKAGFDSLIKSIRDGLRDSKVLETIRKDLATQLSRALPESINRDDLQFVPGATADDDVLSGVRLQVHKGGIQRSVSDQSDGIRALYAIALYDLISGSAEMAGIDEPEIHLHPSSQRSLGRLLQSGKNQRFIATHSADIVSSFPIDCVISVRTGGRVVQPASDFLSDDARLLVRWWVRDKIEPLTARRIVAVEGLSDSIVLQRAAELSGRELDRLGISIVETGGAGDMGPIRQLFGPNGFDIPISMLIDRDAAVSTATNLGISESELNSHSVWISDRDLEEEYTSALGAAHLWAAIEHSNLFTRNELSTCARSGPEGTLSNEDVAAFCRKKSSYKVRAAMVVAEMLDQTTAEKIQSINDLLNDCE